MHGFVDREPNRCASIFLLSVRSFWSRCVSVDLSNKLLCSTTGCVTAAERLPEIWVSVYKIFPVIYNIVSVTFTLNIRAHIVWSSFAATCGVRKVITNVCMALLREHVCDLIYV